MCLGWAGRICAAACNKGYDLTYYNLGIRRNTSTDIRNRWRSEVSRRLPSESEYDGRVVFSFGVNDTTMESDKIRVRFEDSVRNARDILESANQEFSTLMVGPPPIADFDQNRRTARLSHAFASICDELAIPYLDIFTPLEKSKTWMHEVATYDGAHPRAAGYNELAHLVQHWSAWQNWLTSNL